jgi:hypothetical protein
MVVVVVEILPAEWLSKEESLRGTTRCPPTSHLRASRESSEGKSEEVGQTRKQFVGDSMRKRKGGFI